MTGAGTANIVYVADAKELECGGVSPVEEKFTSLSRSSDKGMGGAIQRH
jgi:hypothetical protein